MTLWPLVLFVSFLGAIVTGLKVVYVAFYAVGLLYFGGGWLLQRGFKGLSVQRPDSRTYAFSDEEVEVSFTLKQSSRVPLAWIRVTEALPSRLTGARVAEWIASVAGRGEERLTYRLRGGRRGVYTTGPVDLVCGDALGMHRMRMTLPAYHDIVVYPTTYRLDELGLPSNLLMGRAAMHGATHPDPTRMAGVRPYQSGDPRQWIHWKATARARELQVKRFDNTVSAEAMIVANLNADDYAPATWVSASELTVATAASLARHLSELGERYGFMTNARLERHWAKPPQAEDREAIEAELQEASPIGFEEGGLLRLAPRRGNAQLMRVLELLAAAQCKSSLDMSKALSQEAGKLAWGSMVLIVTPADTEAIVQRAFLLQAMGLRVYLFVTGDDVKHPQLFQQRRAGVRAYRVQYSASGRLGLKTADQRGGQL